MLTVKFNDGSTYEIFSNHFPNEVPIKISSTEEVSQILEKMNDVTLAKISFIAEDGNITQIYKNQHFHHAVVNGSKLSIFFEELDKSTVHLNELDQALVELANLIVGEDENG